MHVIVWSKNDCPQCESAKRLLKMKGVDYEERNLSTGEWTKEDLFEMAPNVRSVPQIFFDDKCIGGFSELNKMIGGSP
jgi:glutaredoxin 3